jgi:hypothetical protein
VEPYLEKVKGKTCRSKGDEVLARRGKGLFGEVGGANPEEIEVCSGS